MTKTFNPQTWSDIGAGGEPVSPKPPACYPPIPPIYEPGEHSIVSWDGHNYMLWGPAPKLRLVKRQIIFQSKTSKGIVAYMVKQGYEREQAKHALLMAEREAFFRIYF